MLDEAQAGIKTAGRNINNLRYTEDTTLMTESEEELKSLLMKVKEESEKVKVKSLSRVRLFATPWTPGSSVHGIFEARVSTAVGCHFLLQGSSRPKDQTQVSHIVDRRFTV